MSDGTLQEIARLRARTDLLTEIIFDLVKIDEIRDAIPSDTRNTILDAFTTTA